MWYVYLVKCSDSSYYCGITTDLVRRVRQHNGEIKGGARYTRTRQPVKLAYYEQCISRSCAAKREYQIKQLAVNAKRALCRNSSKVQSC
ncbi:GIY-YIG nuclease family protein [Idiomarina seosinensis]|uniref:GIY-YIG nuclease family protein n=1 Tax=Idiomarina seosinensis TaxID=281739 RepID=UPI00384F730E